MPKIMTARESPSTKSAGVLRQRTLLETTRKRTPKETRPPTRTSTTMDIVDMEDEWPTPAESLLMDTTQDQSPPTEMTAETTAVTTPTPDITQPQVDTPMPSASPSKHPPSADAATTTTSTVTPTPSTPARPRVGFSASNTVVEAAQPGENMASVVRKQLAPVFEATNKRTKMLFVKIKLPTEEKPKDPTSAARLKLKELGELMINQDPTTVFYKYKKNSDEEKDACVKLSQLPTTITGIQAYMHGFCPNATGGDVWGSLRIGFNSNPVDFIENVSQEANMRKFWVRKAPLQAADTDYAGWLHLSPEALHPEETADSINEYITNVSLKRKSTAFPIACERRMIWDDKNNFF